MPGNGLADRPRVGDDLRMQLKRYRSIVADSSRWWGFEFRPDDIVISTPPKCGTTWMQMLCAMLVLGTTEFDRPLTHLSPWLDMQLNNPAEVVELLSAQQHRRFIKTHTPLDGLPFDERVTYLCVGRDPRDVALSWDNHMANIDRDKFLAARAAAVGLDDLAELGPPPGPPPEDPIERFRQWVDADPATWMGLAHVLHHLQTFWERRDDPAVALFHYDDMRRDLPGQLRSLAEVLGIEVSDERIRQYAAAATFATMRQRAHDLAPSVDKGHWRDTTEFFHRGESGQWRAVLDDDTLAHYEARVTDLVAPDLGTWAHRGWLGTSRC